MKHVDFLNSLKTLKNRLLQHQTKIPHLAHTFQKTEKTTCSCTDAQGEVKYLYTSQKELTYLLSKKDIKLTAYLCPYEQGWHLSKS